MKSSPHLRPSISDTLFETFFAGGAGGAVVAFFFLVKDLIGGQALFTPSLAGQVIFFGADPAAVSDIDVMAVANMTALHIAAFVCIGVIASTLVRGIAATEVKSVIPAILGVFVLLQVPALLVAGLFFPELGSAIGHGYILVANALAAPVMAIVLVRAQANAHNWEELVEADAPPATESL